MELFKVYGEISVNGAAALRQLKDIDNAGRGTSSALSNVAKQAVGVAAGFGLWQGTTAMVQSLSKSLIGLNANLEQSKVAFSTFLGSTKAGNAFIDELRKFAAATPFQYTELEQYAKRLLAFKFEASQILPMMTAIGNAASGLGGGSEVIGRITLALGQMKVKGRLQAEEMLQLTEAGVAAWDMVAKGLGKTTAEAQDLSRKGLIPADKAIQAIIAGMNEQFPNMMQKQAQTMNGLWSTIKDNLEMFSTDTGAGLFEGLKDEVTSITLEMNRMQKSGELKEWAKDIGNGLVTVYESLDKLKAVAEGALVVFIGFKALSGTALVIEKMGQVTQWYTTTLAEAKAVSQAYQITQMTEAEVCALVTAGRSESAAVTAVMAGTQDAATVSSAALAGAQEAVAVTTAEATAATKAFKIALISTGIGALVVALGTAVTAYEAYGNKAETMVKITEKSKKGLDDERTALEQKVSTIENNIEQLDVLGQEYINYSTALQNSKKETVEHAEAQQSLSKAEASLTEIVGKAGLQRIKTAKDTKAAIEGEKTTIQGKLKTEREALIAATQDQIKNTDNLIKQTKSRIKTLKTEADAYGILNNVYSAWLQFTAMGAKADKQFYETQAKIMDFLGADKMAAKSRSIASMYAQNMKAANDTIKEVRLASKQSEIDKLDNLLVNLQNDNLQNSKDLLKMKAEAAGKTTGDAFTNGLKDSGKDAKEAMESNLKEVGSSIESLMNSVSGDIGANTEEAKLELTSGIDSIIENLNKVGPKAQPAIESMQNALLQANSVVTTGSKDSWSSMIGYLKEALTQSNSLLASESQQTSQQISRSFQKALTSAQTSYNNYVKNVTQKTEEQINKLGDAVQSAIRNKFEKQKDYEKQSIQDSIDAEKSRVDGVIQEIERERDYRIGIYNDQIEAIDALTEKEDREAKQAQNQTKIKELQVQLEEAKSADERQRIAQELSDTQNDIARQAILDQREDQKKSIRTQIEAAQSQADQMIDIQNTQYEMYQKSREEEEKRIDDHYAKILQATVIFEMARYLILTKNFSALSELISNYGDQMSLLGTTIGNSLSSGAQSGINSIQSYLSSALSGITGNLNMSNLGLNFQQLLAQLNLPVNQGQRSGSGSVMDVVMTYADGTSEYVPAGMYSKYVDANNQWTGPSVTSVTPASSGGGTSNYSGGNTNYSGGTSNTGTNTNSGGGGSSSYTTTAGNVSGLDSSMWSSGESVTVTQNSNGTVTVTSSDGSFSETISSNHDGGEVVSSGKKMGSILSLFKSLKSDETLRILQYGEEVIPANMVRKASALQSQLLRNSSNLAAAAGGGGISIDVHDNHFQDGTDLGNKLERVLKRYGV